MSTHSTARNPWLNIPAHEYEAHMDEIGQAAALREIFARTYAATRPRQLLVLGCTTGRDLELVDPTVTERSVGVDINAAYLDLARARLSPAAKVDLVPGDVLTVELPIVGFDLVHVALLFEYVDPLALFHRITGWLAPGGVASVVTQNPAEGIGPVSTTGYASLRPLGGHMTLHDPSRVNALASGAGLERVSSSEVPLPGGKSFSAVVFRHRSRERTDILQNG